MSANAPSEGQREVDKAARHAPMRDPWHHLATATPARIALGRSGSALPTREVLSFALDHARARDAVHAEINRARLAEQLRQRGLTALEAESRAINRQHYLQRPDLGRRLDDVSLERLRQAANPNGGLAIAIADGLSAKAVETHAVSVVDALLPHIEKLGLTLSPLVICRGGRVGLGDEIGMALGASMMAMLIGERPGLSSPDGLSVYLTHSPQPGRTDAERNCISNIRTDGLAPPLAAARLAWLIDQARTLGQTGVALKDESEEPPKLEG